jgi:hypothetical protein
MLLIVLYFVCPVETLLSSSAPAGSGSPAGGDHSRSRVKPAGVPPLPRRPPPDTMSRTHASREPCRGRNG